MNKLVPNGKILILSAEMSLKIPIIRNMGIIFLAIILSELSSGDYDLSINHGFYAFFEKYPMFGGKMGAATTLAQKGLGAQDPTKKFAN